MGAMFERNGGRMDARAPGGPGGAHPEPSPVPGDGGTEEWLTGRSAYNESPVTRGAVTDHLASRDGVLSPLQYVRTLMARARTDEDASSELDVWQRLWPQAASDTV